MYTVNKLRPRSTLQHKFPEQEVKHTPQPTSHPVQTTISNPLTTFQPSDKFLSERKTIILQEKQEKQILDAIANNDCQQLKTLLITTNSLSDPCIQKILKYTIQLYSKSMFHRVIENFTMNRLQLKIYALILAIEYKEHSIFSVLLKSLESYDALAKNNNSLETIIKCTFTPKNTRFLDKLLTCTIFTNYLDKKLQESYQGNKILYLAVAAIERDSMECFELLITKYPQFLFLEANYHTLLSKAFSLKHDKAITLLLENPNLQPELLNPYYDTHIPYYNKRLSVTEKKLAITRKMLANDLPSFKEDITKAALAEEAMDNLVRSVTVKQNKDLQYLDLATVKFQQRQHDIFASARSFVSNLSDIAVYMCIGSISKNENIEKIYTFGDENACINIVHKIIALGSKKITLYLKIRNSIYLDQDKEVKNILPKIAYLFNGVDISKPLPQIIIKNGCAVEIKLYNSSVIESKLASLTLTFSSCLLFREDQSFDNVINLKPFLYYKTNEKMVTRIKDNRAYIKGLYNPSYSILTEQEIDHIGENSDSDFCFNLLTSTYSDNKARLIATFLSTVATMFKEGSIHHGMIYGIHHYLCTQRAPIFYRWLNTANKLLNTKSVIISIMANNLNIDTDSFAINSNTIVYDLTKETTNADSLKFDLKNKKVVIIFYPALPKLLFNHSMNNSDIPCLIEGANTTSFALQYGIPYLSVLPNGDTPIPKTIGDPLQALLIEALSCKLSMTDEELNYMSTLHSYIKQKNYRTAKVYLLSLFDNLPSNGMLRFIWNDRNTDSTDIFNTSTVTIESLIDKAHDKKSLSTTVYNCLLQATDDISDSIVQYIKNHQDPNSLERRHTQMLRDHVNLPMNDTIAMSLHRFTNEVRRETSDDQLKSF